MVVDCIVATIDVAREILTVFLQENIFAIPGLCQKPLSLSLILIFLGQQKLSQMVLRSNLPILSPFVGLFKSFPEPNPVQTR